MCSTQQSTGLDTVSHNAMCSTDFNCFLTPYLNPKNVYNNYLYTFWNDVDLMWFTELNLQCNKVMLRVSHLCGTFEQIGEK